MKRYYEIRPGIETSGRFVYELYRVFKREPVDVSTKYWPNAQHLATFESYGRAEVAISHLKQSVTRFEE